MFLNGFQQLHQFISRPRHAPALENINGATATSATNLFFLLTSKSILTGYIIRATILPVK
jgi:hypothetical protein